MRRNQAVLAIAEIAPSPFSSGNSYGYDEENAGVLKGLIQSHQA